MARMLGMNGFPAIDASCGRSSASPRAFGCRAVKPWAMGRISRLSPSPSRSSKRAAAAGDAMTSITRQVKSVETLIFELTSAAREQPNGIGQINQSIASIDQVTQLNAALVEESAAATESLKVQAERLAESVITRKSRGDAPLSSSPESICSTWTKRLSRADARESPKHHPERLIGRSNSPRNSQNRHRNGQSAGRDKAAATLFRQTS